MLNIKLDFCCCDNSVGFCKSSHKCYTIINNFMDSILNKAYQLALKIIGATSVIAELWLIISTENVFCLSVLQKHCVLVGAVQHRQYIVYCDIKIYIVI